MPPPDTILGITIYSFAWVVLAPCGLAWATSCPHSLRVRLCPVASHHPTGGDTSQPLSETVVARNASLLIASSSPLLLHLLRSQPVTEWACCPTPIISF